jgi:hypothetical protein
MVPTPDRRYVGLVSAGWGGSVDVDETLVPAHPVVEIEVSAEAVTVDGVVVDRGSAGGPDTTVAMHLGVHAAARRVAQPLDRPVRAVLRSGDDEKRLVIHPDGSVTGVEDTFPVVSLVAPAGSRGVRISRHARRLSGAALRVRRTRLTVGAAYVALGAVLAGGILAEAVGGDDPPSQAAGADEEPPAQESAAEPVPPAVPALPAVVAGARLERLPHIGKVVVGPDSGGFRVRLTTRRAGRVTVRAALLPAGDETRLWTIRTGGATSRTLEVDDLEAGTYRWVVRAPGERPVTGRVVVPPTPEPPSTVTVRTTPQPGPTTDGGRPARGNDDGGDGRGGDAGGGGADSRYVGPAKPVDPDDPMAR